MRIPACIFTYGGAALRLPWAVRGAMQAGLVPVVCQDVADPLPQHVLGWLEIKGVEVRDTTFPRRGNLNGTDCASGICQEMAAACRRYGSTHAVKLDDDTVVVRSHRFMVPRDVAVGLSWPQGGRNAAFGMAYALPGYAAVHMAEDLRSRPLDPKAPEDLTVWGAAYGLCQRQLHVFDPDGGPFTAIPYGCDVEDVVRRFDVVTVGNPPATGWRDRDRQMAGVMKRLVQSAGRLQGAGRVIA